MGLRSIFALLTVVGGCGYGFSQSDPVSVYDFSVGKYSHAIPKPFSTAGFTIGDRHITSWETVEYVSAVAAASDRVQAGNYGRTHDGRVLPYAVVSSSQNLRRLDEIVEQNRKNVFSPGSVSDSDLAKMPTVVWVGGGVHGNEASGVESCLMTLYHLAADTSDGTRRMLDQMVVIVAPMYNPDGRDRFATWVNAQRGKHALADGQDTEHSEPWPGGRTNKYWFDLNRDWFPLSQPESSGRHKLVMRFRPQVILDYHEQGGENYFFQPGVQTRVNPYTPKANQAMTFKFASYYAKDLEAVGEAYFTEQRYDDFYIGKGSTYPDVIGSIGILFEQASSRSLLRPTGDGTLSFAHTVRNQVVTSLASLNAARDMRVELLKYQREFFKDVPPAGPEYVIKDDEAGRELVSMLLAHEIRITKIREGYLVSTIQPLSRLIKAMFEPQKEFSDTVFYDISSWSLLYVTNAQVTRFAGSDVTRTGGETVTTIGDPRPARNAWPNNMIGVLMRSDRVMFHSAVRQAMADGRKGFYVTRALGDARPGDVYFPASEKDQNYFAELGDRFSVRLHGVAGQTGEIVSWGGNAVTALPAPNIALLVGEGVDSNNAGEQWFMLDRKLDIPVALLDVSRIGSLDLSRYSAILVTGGRYPAATVDALTAFVRGGGTVVATASGASWAASTSLWTLKSNSIRSDFEGLSYGELQDARGVDPVPGSVFEVEYDKTHPLSWGQTTTAVFREGGSFWDVPNEPGVTVARYTAAPLLSGYVSPGIEDIARGKAAVVAKRVGAGRVVLIADNPCFRGYMTSQQKVWLNSLLFSRAF